MYNGVPLLQNSWIPKMAWDTRSLRYTEFSIIFQVIIEMHMLRLVKDCIISFYNHPTRDDYNIKALIFKMDTAWFLDVSEGEMNKRKENTVVLIITWAKYYFSPQAQWILSNNPLDFVSGLFDNNYSLRLWWIIVKRYYFITVMHWHKSTPKDTGFEITVLTPPF